MRRRLSRVSLNSQYSRNALPTHRACALCMSFRCVVQNNETARNTRGSGNLERERIARMCARYDVCNDGVCNASRNWSMPRVRSEGTDGSKASMSCVGHPCRS
jgi:hypothetical protein